MKLIDGFVFIFAVIESIRAQLVSRSIRECKPGDKWVESYIEYECLIDGIKPIGCSSKEGEMGFPVAIGNHYNDKSFVYECANAGTDYLIYRSIQCIAEDGHAIDVGESYLDAAKVTWQCTRKENGQLETIHTGVRKPACTYEGVEIEKGQKITLPATHNDEYLAGTTVACEFVNNTWVPNIIGCTTSKNDIVYLTRIINIDNKIFQCTLENNKAKLTELSGECKVGGKTYRVNETWIDLEKMTEYTCKATKVSSIAVITVTGCMYSSSKHGNLAIKLNSVLTLVYNNGTRLYRGCKEGPGMIGYFVNLIPSEYTCTIADTTKVANDVWVIDGIVFGCVWMPYCNCSQVFATKCQLPNNSSLIVNEVSKINDTHYYVCYNNDDLTLTLGIFKEDELPSGLIISNPGGSGTSVVNPTTTTTSTPTTTEEEPDFSTGSTGRDTSPTVATTTATESTTKSTTESTTTESTTKSTTSASTMESTTSEPTTMPTTKTTRLPTTSRKPINECEEVRNICQTSCNVCKACKNRKDSKEHGKGSREHGKDSKEHEKGSREHGKDSKEHGKGSREHGKDSKEHGKGSKEHRNNSNGNKSNQWYKGHPHSLQYWF